MRKNKNIVPLKDLNLTDRFLFDEVLEDKDTYQDVLGIIFGKEIPLLDQPQGKIWMRYHRNLLNSCIMWSTLQMRLPKKRRVKLNGNVQIDMEMQVIMFTYWAERSLYYLSKMFTEQLLKGQDYDTLQKCIHVGILDFELFGSEEFYSRFHMWEDFRKELYSDKLEIHILELPKLAKFQYPQTEILSWARFFNGEEKEEFEMLAKSDEYVQKAYDKLVDISL